MKLKHKLLKYPIVSFDIYDTLIKRDVSNPEDVYILLAKAYKKEYQQGNKTEREVFTLRLKAQKKAEKNKLTEEYCLSDIYRYSNFEQGEKDFLIRKEQELECELSHRNLLIGQLYDWCVFCGKRIIIASDMYLPFNSIHTILKKNDYKYHERVYLSSYVGKRKSTGNLFKHILEEEKCSCKNIIHIGDAKRGDFLRPIQFGIRAVLIPQRFHSSLLIKRISKQEKCRLESELPNDKISYGILTSFFNNRADPSMDIMYRIGYELFGSIVYGYCRWLHEQVITYGISHIFFLAREGVVLEQAYHFMYPDESDSHSVLRVSRHALRRPLEEPNGEAGILLKQYLADEGFIICNEKEVKRIAVADVGWKGTMQHQLSDIISDKSIIGFYVGKKLASDISGESYGYLFQEDERKAIQNEIMFTATFFENSFMIQEGSTLKYQKNKSGKVVPILDACEQSEDIIAVVMRIREGMMAFVKEISSKQYMELVELSPQVAELGYGHFMRNVKTDVIKHFNSMICKDDEGTSRITTKYGSAYYVLHPRKLGQEFMCNKSKLLFLKSLCPIPLPYMWILRRLKIFEEHIKKRQSNRRGI